MTVEGEINGLYPTPVRLKLVAALTEPGRIYREAGQVYDRVTGFKVTARVDEMLSCDWLRFATDEERHPTAEAATNRKHYRVTNLGQRARSHR